MECENLKYEILLNLTFKPQFNSNGKINNEEIVVDGRTSTSSFLFNIARWVNASSHFKNEADC